MFLVDIIILIFLGLCFLVGFKRGMLTELLSLVGIIVIAILSYFLKNPISVFLYKYLPFFKFDFILKRAVIFNIILYEVLAFLIVFSVLLVLFKLLLRLTKIVDRILEMSIIFTIPSKIIGGLVGTLKGIIVLFIILYILSIPMMPFDVSKTKIGSFMLDKTPILNTIVKDKLKVFNEISDLVSKYKDKDNTNKFNQESLELLIKYKTITRENAEDLISRGKLKGLKVK